MRQPICCIYKIVSPTGRVYIGRTRDLRQRVKSYRSQKTRGQRILQASIIKYGWNEHILEIAHQLPLDVEEEVINRYEMLYIEQYMSNKIKHTNGRGMNMSDGGEGNNGYICTDEVRMRIKENMAGKRRPSPTGQNSPQKSEYLTLTLVAAIIWRKRFFTSKQVKSLDV